MCLLYSNKSVLLHLPPKGLLSPTLSGVSQWAQGDSEGVQKAGSAKGEPVTSLLPGLPGRNSPAQTQGNWQRCWGKVQMF